MSSTLSSESLKFIDGPIDDIGKSVTTDPNGNIYVYGYTNSTAAGPFRFADVFFQKPVTNDDAIFIGKIGANGSPLWLRMLDGVSAYLGNPVADQTRTITVDTSGNVYVTGYATNTGTPLAFATCPTVASGDSATTEDYNKPTTSSTAIVLLKLNTSGDLQWLRTLDGTNSEDGFSICVNSNFNLVQFTGYTNSVTDTTFEYGTCNLVPALATIQTWYKGTTNAQSVIIGQLYSSNGVLTWLDLIDGVDTAPGEQGIGIAFMDNNDGDIVVTGYTNTSGTTINFIQCSTSINPPTPVSYTKITTTVEALFVLKLYADGGGLVWMNILDCVGENVRGIAVTTKYDATTGDAKVYLTGTLAIVGPLPLPLPQYPSMTYSSVVPSGIPSTQPWYIPTTVSQTATLIAKIDFFTANLEFLKFFDTVDNPERPTGIAVSQNTPNVYISGWSTWEGTSGTVNFISSYSDAGPTIVAYPLPSLVADNGFILNLDESLKYVESKWIDSANVGGYYRLNGITVDAQDNVYIIGYTDATDGGPVINFGDELLTKPETTGISSFVGKLKNVFLPSPICYAKGTLIATSRGFVPIEDIKLSDKLRTYDRIEERMFRPIHGVAFKTFARVADTRLKNRFANIKFIGNFNVNIMNEHTAPIRITAGALGKNKPERDLLVSSNHSILIGDRMIFAKNLVNGRTIYQDMSFKKIEYYHILSDDHYLINANGTLSETLGTEELKLFETMIYAQSKVYEPLALENKYHLQNIAT